MAGCIRGALGGGVTGVDLDVTNYERDDVRLGGGDNLRKVAHLTEGATGFRFITKSITSGEESWEWLH